MATILTLICWTLINMAVFVVVCSPAIAVVYCVYAFIRDKKEAQKRKEWMSKNW